QVGGSERGAESMNVAINDVAVDAQVAVGPDDRRVAELLPNSIYELVECVARATGIGLGPQHRQDAVARHTAVRVGRQESKKGQALPLVGEHGGVAVSGRQEQAGEGLEAVFRATHAGLEAK